jgi:hypothetical protein
MLYPLPKNVYSLCLVSTLVITTHPPRCCEVRARLVADKLANGKEPKDARRGCAIAIAIVRRWSLGIFRLFAIGELVGYKPCANLAASWRVSGDGQCRDETQ